MIAEALLVVHLEWATRWPSMQLQRVDTFAGCEVAAKTIMDRYPKTQRSQQGNDRVLAYCIDLRPGAQP